MTKTDTAEFIRLRNAIEDRSAEQDEYDLRQLVIAEELARIEYEVSAKLFRRLRQHFYPA